MLCEKCGAEIKGSEAFCTNCGAPVSSTVAVEEEERATNVEITENDSMEQYPMPEAQEEAQEKSVSQEPGGSASQQEPSVLQEPSAAFEYMAVPAPVKEEPLYTATAYTGQYNSGSPLPNKPVRRAISPLVIGSIFIVFSIIFGIVYAVPLAMYVPSNFLVGVANIVAVVAAGVLLVTGVVLATGRVGVSGSVLASAIANVALGMHIAAAMVYGTQITITNFGEGIPVSSILNLWPLALELLFSIVVLLCAGILVYTRRKRERVN